MPANKNAETRYKILDQLLANRYHHYSTEDLREKINEKLEELSLKPVSLRTIVYDLNYLEHGPFAADIEHYQIDDVSKVNPNKTVKKNCHRYRDRSFSIYQQKMSEDEKQILGEAMKLLGQFDGLPHLGRLEALRAGLDIKPSRQIISFTKNPLENNNVDVRHINTFVEYINRANDIDYTFGEVTHNAVAFIESLFFGCIFRG